MKNKNLNFRLIINIVIIVLFISIFFFKIIPIPVENVEGDKNPDKFIFGGFYYTSVLYEIQVGNAFAPLGFNPLLFFAFINNYLFKNKREKWRDENK